MNTELFYSFYSLAHRSALLDSTIAFIAESFGWIVIASVVTLPILFGRPRDKRLWQVAFSSLFAAVVSRFVFTVIIRYFYQSLRPFAVLPNIVTLVPHDPAGALPSGHTAFFFALAAMIFFWNRRIGALYFGAAALISISRVVAGVHWPLDIAAGAALGTATAFVLYCPFLKLQQRYGNHQKEGNIRWPIQD